MRLNEITSTVKHKFVITSESDFDNGFTVKLYANRDLIGKYSYALDEERLSRHGVDVVPAYLNKGYGVILTLKAIQLANDHELGYSEDSLGHTADMERVYKSILRKNLATASLGQFQLTNAGETFLDDFENT